jgi:hypothetical protein
MEELTDKEQETIASGWDKQRFLQEQTFLQLQRWDQYI